MDWLESLILGVVQGLAEYLPISSSGHLQICRDVLDLKLGGAEAMEFDVALHAATVLSTIVVLWKEFLPLCKSFFTFKNDSNTQFVLKILLSCIPIMIVGFLLSDYIEKLFTGNLLIVGICLIVTALLLSFSYFYRTRSDDKLASATGLPKPARDINFRDAFIIGCAQAIAVLPGLSRSGSTIATGLILGDKREQVARFSFFMVIIPILGEALLNLKDMLTETAEPVAQGAATVGEQVSVGMGATLIGFFSAFIVGCLACKWMLDIVKKGKLIWFAVYCAIVGTFCILFNICG